MKISPIFLMACCLSAGGKMVQAGEAVLKKDVLTIDAAPYRALFAKPSSWTIRQMSFNNKMVLSQTGAFQTVISVKRAPDDPERDPWIGTGHGKEIVESFQLEVDDKVQELTENVPIRGDKFALVKQSRLGPYRHWSRVTLDGPRLSEEFDYEVIEDDKPVHFMYAFMHCFTNNSQDWMAELADKTIESGIFLDNGKFTLKKDIRWAAWHAPKDNIGLVYVYPEVYAGSKGANASGAKANAFWNRPRDNKLYFQPDLPRGIGTKFGYKVTLQAFEATPENWQQRAKNLIAEISDAYEKQADKKENAKQANVKPA